jgi:predicted secreted protein
MQFFFYQIYIYCGIWRGQFVVVVGFGRSSTQPSKTLKLRTMPTVPHSSRIQVRTVHLHFMASTRTVTNWYILCSVLSISCRPIPSSWSNTPVSSNPSFTKSASIYQDGSKKKTHFSATHTSSPQSSPDHSKHKFPFYQRCQENVSYCC